MRAKRTESRTTDHPAADPTPFLATETDAARNVSRRSFLGAAAGASAAGLLLTPQRAGAQSSSRPTPVEDIDAPPPGQSDAIGPENGTERRNHAYEVRVDAARFNRRAPVIAHQNNGDEELYADKIGNYSKGLPHNRYGEVDVTAYASLITALSSGRKADFEAIVMGNPLPGTRNRLTNPQAGLAFDLEGRDCHQLAQPPAPTFASAEEAGESVENYWMAHLRDTPFTDYATDALAQRAAADLSRLSDFRGPKQGGVVTAQSMFRDDLPGTLVGPYVSQFFWVAQPFGAQFVEPRVQTTVPGVDYMTSTAAWLDVQNGVLPPFGNQFDATLRYIRNGRDLGQWVHIDVLFQAYFQAMLSLLQGPNIDPRFSGLACAPNPGNPYIGSATQIGFGTFGGPYFATILCEAATRALKAVWFQKWFVHRRLRPEAFGGRVHFHLTGDRSYPLHPDVLNSDAVAEAFSRNGTYLLPAAFPEGSPTHPAYGAGHATVAGASVTILKALFDTDRPWTDLAQPVVAAPDGLSVSPYLGADAGQMTIAGELNKLASNVATGRNIASVHWRTDAIESLRLGEALAISILRDQRGTYNEEFDGYTFTRFDGTSTTV